MIRLIQTDRLTFGQICPAIEPETASAFSVARGGERIFSKYLDITGYCAISATYGWKPDNG
jgi:hypothetical protein